MAHATQQIEHLGTNDVATAYSVIEKEIHNTHILTSAAIDSLVPGINLFFKAELFQQTGSFKYRGACHALSCLSPEELKRGVITHSSGNHGAALAAAAQKRGVKCDVIMVCSRDSVLTDEFSRRIRAP